jgi:DHA1 family multidrug resistance protein-like MFS transporter
VINIRRLLRLRLNQWLEPQLFQPFVFGILISLTLSEFVRGALTLSLLPTYGKTVLGFAVEWTALALSIHYLVDNLLRAPAGWLADRIGQRFVLLIGFAIATGSIFWMMNARTVTQLMLSLALYGVGVTPMWPSAISGIGTHTPEQSRAAFMGYLYIFWLAGAGLGPVLINLVIGRSYRPAFWLLLAVDAVGFVLAWALVRSHADHREITPSAHPADGVYWRSLWQNVRQVAFLFPGMFAQTFAVASLIPILSVYAKVVLHISGAAYSSILVAGGAFTVILLIPAGKLVDRFGPRVFLVSAFLLAGLGLGSFPFFRTLPFAYAMVVILGICYAFILPAWNTVLDKSIDKDKKGALWGVFMTVEGLGSAAGPYVGGLMWDIVSPSAPFLVSASVIALMGVLYIFLPIQARHGKNPRSAGHTDGLRVALRRQRTRT